MFKEHESWNGTLDTLADAQVPLMEGDDVEEKEHFESKTLALMSIGQKHLHVSFL